MSQIYQVTIRGSKLESQDLRQLLARAVREKRNLDARLRIASAAYASAARAWSSGGPGAAGCAVSTLP